MTGTGTHITPRRRVRPRVRKFLLVLHVCVSVGWFGGGYAMLVLGVAALTSAGSPLRPAAYQLMHLGDRAIMIPGSLGALGTGLTLALSTQWGLLRHWWVVAKLTLTVGTMAFAYAFISQNVKAALTGHELGALPQYVIAGCGTVLVTLATTIAVSIFKPWGRIRR
ncbi:hypothetical protein [Spongiactinospora sp. 9N601]|uniref:hypothetical protein n=1 Tax=Spongiactinospora sp. 9N601 TaxID=3375149 RepID=UPI0037ADF926